VSEADHQGDLMAGRARPDDWTRGDAGTQDDQKSPLDLRYGAGSLRVDNSFDILVFGQHSAVGASTGWDMHGEEEKPRLQLQHRRL